jgi:hypothetical protein
MAITCGNYCFFLIFYILTILEFYFTKMPNAERLQKAFFISLPAFYIIVAAICVAFALYKTGTSGWGVLICYWVSYLYLTKGKE